MCFPTARVAVAQSSSLSLFTNRDAELEQRAMLLKRLAFTIYSSEVDQYQKYLPDIQGEHTCAVRVQCFRYVDCTQLLLSVRPQCQASFAVCPCAQSAWWRVCVCPRCPSSTLRCSCSSECCCCACHLNISPLCGPP